LNQKTSATFAHISVSTIVKKLLLEKLQIESTSFLFHHTPITLHNPFENTFTKLIPMDKHEPEYSDRLNWICNTINERHNNILMDWHMHKKQRCIEYSIKEIQGGTVSENGLLDLEKQKQLFEFVFNHIKSEWPWCHDDIAPSNIICVGDGDYQLIDFDYQIVNYVTQEIRSMETVLNEIVMYFTRSGYDRDIILEMQEKIIPV